MKITHIARAKNGQFGLKMIYIIEPVYKNRNTRHFGTKDQLRINCSERKVRS